MSGETIVGIISAGLALLSLLGTLYFSNEARKASNAAQASEENANRITIGQSETLLREAISRNSERIGDISIRIAEILAGRKPEKLDSIESAKLKVLESARKVAVENYLNAYEDACGKFLDGKIDKERFKKMYVEEVRNLCDPTVESYSRMMHPKSNSKYEAIWKIYDEWHRHEK